MLSPADAPEPAASPSTLPAFPAQRHDAVDSPVWLPWHLLGVHDVPLTRGLDHRASRCGRCHRSMEYRLGRRAAHVNMGECRSTEELPAPGFWAPRSQGGFSPAVPGTARQGRCAPQAQASLASPAQNDISPQCHSAPRDAARMPAPVHLSALSPHRVWSSQTTWLPRNGSCRRHRSPLRVRSQQPRHRVQEAASTHRLGQTPPPYRHPFLPLTVLKHDTGCVEPRSSWS